MTHDAKPRLVSRREVLTLAAGLGAAAALRFAPARSQTAAAKPLLTRPIPRTGERLAVVGLGTAIVFDIGNDAAKRAERRSVIQTLLEGGARAIDTAPSYGTAESVLGDLLAEMKVRDKAFVATKVRVAGRERAVAEMQQSQARLRTEKFDLMQIHNVGFADRGEIAARIPMALIDGNAGDRFVRWSGGCCQRRKSDTNDCWASGCARNIGGGIGRLGP